jgi:hypothetical protein
MQKKLLFIHIPKTGGTSILNKLFANGLDNWKRVMPFNHDPLFMLERNNLITEQTFKFSVARNPYTRTFSYYKHFCVKNNLNISANEFLFFLKRKNNFFPNTPFVIYPQSFFIYDQNGEYVLNKIYKQEKFYEIEEDLQIKFDHINKGNYEIEEYLEFVSKKDNIELIRELFSVDFFNFNYDIEVIPNIP